MAITLNQIAELCGVSRGTVDRALHNKGRVRPELAARIKRVAAEHGYTPNRAGMALSRAGRPIKIGVVLHSADTPFIQMVLEACRREATRLAGFSTKVIFRISRTLDPLEQVAMIDDLLEQHQLSGLAIMPLASALVEDKLNTLIDEHHLPVVTFNTDLPHSRRICYIGQDNRAAGRTAAALMRLVTGGQGVVSAMIGPSEYHYAYTDRLVGFRQELTQTASGLCLTETKIASDEVGCARQAAEALLRDTPALRGIYVITPGYAGVCAALAASGRAGEVHLILHDEIAANLHALRDGVADFLIGQDAEEQGARPLALLADYIQLGRRPEKTFFHTDIRVLLRHNIGNLL